MVTAAIKVQMYSNSDGLYIYIVQIYVANVGLEIYLVYIYSKNMVLAINVWYKYQRGSGSLHGTNVDPKVCMHNQTFT